MMFEEALPCSISAPAGTVFKRRARYTCSAVHQASFRLIKTVPSASLMTLRLDANLVLLLLLSIAEQELICVIWPGDNNGVLGCRQNQWSRQMALTGRSLRVHRICSGRAFLILTFTLHHFSSIRMATVDHWFHRRADLNEYFFRLWREHLDKIGARRCRGTQAVAGFGRMSRQSGKKQRIVSTSIFAVTVQRRSCFSFLFFRHFCMNLRNRRL